MRKQNHKFDLKYIIFYILKQSIMFKAKHSNPKFLYSLFDSLTGVLNDFNLNIKSDGIYINELDSSHVAMIMLELNEDDFESYECNDDFTIGINLKNLVALLKAGKNSRTIDLSSHKDSSELDISFSTSYDVKEFSLKLMDMETNDIEPNDMDYYCEFDVSPNIFNDILDSASVTGANEITATIRNNALSFVSEGDMGKLMQNFKKEAVNESKKMVVKDKDGNVKKSVPHPKNKTYELHSCSGNFTNSFSLPMMQLFKKATSLVDKISVNISPEVPIRIDYMLNDDTGSLLQFYLAPKITDD